MSETEATAAEPESPRPATEATAAALVSSARAALVRGDTKATLELAKEALSMDVAVAGGHAILSRALLESRRPRGARVEAEKAIDGDARCARGHESLGFVLRFERSEDEAKASFLRAVELDPASVDAHRGLASLASRKDASTRVLHLEAARKHAPDRIGVLVDLGAARLEQGEEAEAASLAEAAIAIDPKHRGALVLHGRILFARGDVAAAKRAVILALRKRWTPDAIELLGKIKSHENPWVGPWFRFNAWYVERSGSTASALMVGSFLLIHLAKLILRDLDLPTAALVLHYVWLFASRWQYIAHSVFHHMVKSEIADPEAEAEPAEKD